MNNYKLVFTTGVPGSCWSMISNRFKRTIAGFDRTDEVDDHNYKMPEAHSIHRYNIIDPTWKQTTHHGSYFGPYHKFGHGFDNIPNNYSTESFLKECLAPFSDTRKNKKLIRSHWFAYNLDWLWDNCKGHQILMIQRDPVMAEEWWYSMGGWDINYPVYKWYENRERMTAQIQIENDSVISFAQKHNIEWWDFDNHGEYLHSRFPNTRRLEHKAHPMINDTIKVAYFDIK